MPKLQWDANGARKYETGLDRGVLYLKEDNGSYPLGEAWNGLTKVSENPDGASITAKYANNNKYGNLVAQENFKATIEAFTYPDSWEEADGSREVIAGVSVGQQRRRTFGITWRTLIGNDVKGTSYGYKINIAYEGVASPSKRDSATVNETPDMASLSWDIETTPLQIGGVDSDGNAFLPAAKITIDSTKVNPAKLAAVEAILYGSDGTGGGNTGTVARLPLPTELFQILGVTTSTTSTTTTTTTSHA